ncbi:MAG: hypothetical protein HC842_07980, partial [Cytophagales bacterium]|nr:hypothetical protein [Cytophagales bacterium]
DRVRYDRGLPYKEAKGWVKALHLVVYYVFQLLDKVFPSLLYSKVRG